MSSYNSNIPQPDDRIDVSQNDLLQNFQQLDTTMATDHFQFSTSSNNGRHRQVRMPERSSNPPNTNPNEGAVYTFQGPSSSQTELFFRQENKTGAFEIPTKDLALPGVGAMGAFTGGGAAIGSNNINISAAIGGTGIFSMIFGIPMPTSNYMIFCGLTVSSANNNLTTWKAHGKSQSGFTLFFSQRSGGSTSFFNPLEFYVLVIGGLA